MNKSKVTTADIQASIDKASLRLVTPGPRPKPRKKVVTKRYFLGSNKRSKVLHRLFCVRLTQLERIEKRGQAGIVQPAPPGIWRTWFRTNPDYKPCKICLPDLQTKD